MSQYGIKKDNQSYNELILLYGINKPKGGMIGEMGSKKMIKQPSLKKALTRSDKIKKIKEIIHHNMKDNGIELNIYNHNAIVNSYCSLGELDLAVSYVEHLLTTNAKVVTNDVIFITLITNLTKRGHYKDIKKSWSLYHKIKELGTIEISAILYNQMIRVCGQYEDCELAISIFQEMQSKFITPSLYTYSNLIYTLGQRHDYYHQSFQYFKQLISENYRPDVYILSNLLYICSRHGDLNHAIEIFEQSYSLYHIKPNQIMYHNLLKTFGKVAIYTDYHIKSIGNTSREKRILMAHKYLKQMEQQSYGLKAGPEVGPALAGPDALGPAEGNLAQLKGILAQKGKITAQKGILAQKGKITAQREFWGK